MKTTLAKRLDDGRVEIVGPKAIALKSALPDVRISSRGVRATLTPAVAQRLVKTADLIVDDEIFDLASAMLAGRRDDATQPARRKTESWRHQAEAFNFARERVATLLDMGMGTGKTKVVADLANNWPDVKSVLVCCPLAVLGTWAREFDRHGPDDYSIAILDHSTAKAKIREAERVMNSDAGLKIFVINYESAWRPKGFARWGDLQAFDLVVADEIHRIKSATGKASAWLYKTGRRARRRLGLTGTPIPNDPLDLFGQFRFLDVGLFGSSFVRFRSRYAITDPIFKSQVRSWINQDEMRDLYHSMAFKVSRDVLDLPPVRHVELDVELSPAERAVFDSMKEEALAVIGTDDLDQAIEDLIDGKLATASTPLVKLLRLQQISAGHVKTEAGTVEPVHDRKLYALVDLVGDIEKDVPVCVFAQWRHDFKLIRQAAAKLGRRYGEISGERKDLTAHSTYPEDVDLLAVQWQSGSTGIDLTRAPIGVIFSPTYNGGDYEQGLARQHRPGQTKPTVFYHLIARGTSDRGVYRAMKKKGIVRDEILREQLPRWESSELPGSTIGWDEFTAAGGELCPHGQPTGRCSACDHLSDLAFDADRESRFFGR